MTELAYADDLEVAAAIDLGEYEVRLDEIREFSERWDPQPFHTDESAAASGFFGETIASGIQTLAILQRLSVLAVYADWAVLAGRRLREVNFEAPVRPGMVLRGSMIVQAIEHTSADRSLVTVVSTLHHGDTRVLSSIQDVYVWRRSGL